MALPWGVMDGVEGQAAQPARGAQTLGGKKLGHGSGVIKCHLPLSPTWACSPAAVWKRGLLLPCIPKSSQALCPAAPAFPPPEPGALLLGRSRGGEFPQPCFQRPSLCPCSPRRGGTRGARRDQQLGLSTEKGMGREIIKFFTW